MLVERRGLLSIMMGIHQPQPELFSYQVNLDKPVRADHPLRRVAQAVDFAFVRAEVAGLVGGDKLHADASLIGANASKDSVIKSSPELIAA